MNKIGVIFLIFFGIIFIIEPTIGISQQADTINSL